MTLHFTQPQPLSQIVIPYILTLPITALPPSPPFQASHLLISTFCLLSSLHLSTLTLIILWPYWDLQSIEPIKFSQQPIPLMSLVPSLPSLNSMFHACVLNSLLVSTHLFLLPAKSQTWLSAAIRLIVCCIRPADEPRRKHVHAERSHFELVHVFSSVVVLYFWLMNSPLSWDHWYLLFLQALKTFSIFAHDFDSYFSEEIETMRK